MLSQTVYTAPGREALFLGYVNGKRREYHCVDGPVAVFATGEREYLVNDLRHRVNGVAVIGPVSDQVFEFWVKDQNITIS